MLMDQWLALLLTWAIEIPLLLRFNRRQPQPRSWRYAACIGLLASGVTHPFAWRAMLVFAESPWQALAWIETAVVLVEAALYRLLLFRSAGEGLRAVWASLACNGASTLAGIFLSFAFWSFRII